ncbi:MAG: cation diffusion facilitator family transporter [bacterium]|nr:cation diffusion facilitator family transporter [bacterium]
MDKFKAIKRASILGVIGNLFLLVIKAIVGIFTNSQAMLADAFNSASDVFSSIMTFIGNRIASKPSDDDHNLGHGKAEYIYSMLISIAMLFLGYQVIKSSISSLINNNKVEFSIWLVVVCGITLFVKVSLFIYTHYLCKKHNNLLLIANSKDHLNDCMITFLNLVACLLSLKKIYFVDGVVGILISLWIFYTAYKIFIDSYDVLMDKAISNETREEVYKVIKKYKDIKKVTHFNATPVGYQYQISFTIFVDGKMSTFDSHKIANDLEKEIGNKFPEIYLTVIHVNPLEEKKK